MSQKEEKLIEELDTLYKNHSNWLRAGKELHGRVNDSLKENPKISATLKFTILANIGVWSTFALVVFDVF